MLRSMIAVDVSRKDYAVGSSEFPLHTVLVAEMSDCIAYILQYLIHFARLHTANILPEHFSNTIFYYYSTARALRQAMVCSEIR